MMKSLLALVLCCAAVVTARPEAVYILQDAALPQAEYAAKKLAAALAEQKHDVMAERAGYDRLISLAVNPSRLGARSVRHRS